MSEQQQETRGEKRKAEPATTKEAIKAMRTEEMIAFICEIKEDLESLHEKDFFVDSGTLDPTQDPKKVYLGRLREFGHLLYFDTYNLIEKELIPAGANKVDMR